MRDGSEDPAVAASGTVLGFDFGTRKIGVALGNTITGTARPLTTLHEEAKRARFAAIAALIVQWEPSALVAGRPLHADGTAHAMTARASAFARELRARYRLPVIEVDERYTTQLADIAQGGRRGGRGDPGRDAVAAQIILQAWLDSRPSASALLHHG